MAGFQAALGQGTRGQQVPTLRETALCVSVWVWDKYGTVGWALAAHASVPAAAEGSLKGGAGYCPCCPCCSCRRLRTVSLLWGGVSLLRFSTAGAVSAVWPP